MTNEQRISKILDIFITSTVKIKDINKLKEYIEFCVKNDEHKRLRDEEDISLTSHHHILPKADSLPFEECKDIDKIQWNGSHLTHKNHYDAHHILVYALDEASMLYAFITMNNQGIKNGRLNEEDLIGAEEFERLMIEKNKTQSKLMNSEEWKATKGQEKSRKQKEIFNDTEWKDTVRKEKRKRN